MTLISSIGEIVKDLELITPEMIARSEQEFDALPKDAKVFGTIHNEDIKKLWVLFDVYMLRSRQANLSKLDPMNPLDTIQTEEANEKENGYGLLAMLVRDIMWFETRKDLSTLRMEKPPEHLTIYKGFVVAEGTCEKCGTNHNNPGEALPKLLQAIARRMGGQMLNLGEIRIRREDEDAAENN